MDLNEFTKIGYVKQLNDIEVVSYKEFHDFLYKEDLEVSNFLKEKYPRWSIVSGYYSMLNITKYFLALYFVKIKGHKAVRLVLEKILKEHKQELKNIKDPKKLEKLKEWLEKAEEFTEEVVGNKNIEELSFILKEAYKKRENMQYYASRFSKDFLEESALKKQSIEFLNNIVNPYISLMKELIKIKEE